MWLDKGRAYFTWGRNTNNCTIETRLVSWKMAQILHLSWIRTPWHVNLWWPFSLILGSSMWPILTNRIVSSKLMKLYGFLFSLSWTSSFTLLTCPVLSDIYGGCWVPLVFQIETSLYQLISSSYPDTWMNLVKIWKFPR